MITKGSLPIHLTVWSGGMDVYHAREDVPPGVNAVIRNLYSDGESLSLRGGCTAIPQGTHVGALATAGVKGLYVWTPDGGEKHVLAAYPRAGSNKVSIYAVHTAAATALGGDLSTSGRVSFAGFGQKCYVTDGRSRMVWTDGVYTARVPELDRPIAAFNTSYGVPYMQRNTVEDSWGVVAVHFPSYWGLWWDPPATTLWRIHTGWAGSGLAVRALVSSAPGNGHSLRLVGTASLVKNVKARYDYTYSAGFGTVGTWDHVGAVSFWARSSKVGEFLELRMGPASAGPIRMPIRFDQTGRWEYKDYDLSMYPYEQRTLLASAAFVVTNTSQTFTVFMGPLYRDGLLRGTYEYAPAFYRTSDKAESPLGVSTFVSTDESNPTRRAAWLPARSSKDTTVDRTRWYRRGGSSTEWRRVAEGYANVALWDGQADHETGDLSPNVPLPSPRFTTIGRFGESRMIGLGGYDHGDYRTPIPTASAFLATAVWTAMTRVTAAGLSRGVELYSYTAGASAATGRVKLKLQKNSVTQRSVTIAPTNLVNRRWTPMFWTNTAAGNDSFVTLGSGTWRLVYSALGATNWNLGSYAKGKPSYFHLLDYPGRVWVSRQGEPTYFDRLTTLDGVDLDGFWFDLPGAAAQPISGYGNHGSDHLIFTSTNSFLTAGHSAADFTVLRIHSSIGCGAGDTVAEGDNWTFWVAGRKGKLMPYAYGPSLPVAIPAGVEQEVGFTRIGLAIEPILALILDPTHMSGAFAKGKYHLFFGETVTYRTDKYNAATLDLAQGSWVCHYISETNVKAPRFAVTDHVSGGVILASPASSTAGNSTNKLWLWDYPGIYKDGAQSLSYIVEPRHQRHPEARETKLRGYEYRVDQATAGRVTINAYGDGVTAGTLAHNMTAAGGKTLRLTGRFIAQGDNVGLRASGTAMTALVIRSIDLYLDRKR